MALLCRMVPQLQYRTDSTGRIDDHLPGETCNLSRSEPCLHRKQYDDASTKRIASRFGKQEKVVDLVSR